MMRWRPKPQGGRPAPSGPLRAARTAPPLPENPYRRFFTRTPTFETLVRRAPQRTKGPAGSTRETIDKKAPRLFAQAGRLHFLGRGLYGGSTVQGFAFSLRSFFAGAAPAGLGVGAGLGFAAAFAHERLFDGAALLNVIIVRYVAVGAFLPAPGQGPFARLAGLQRALPAAFGATVRVIADPAPFVPGGGGAGAAAGAGVLHPHGAGLQHVQPGVSHALLASPG